MATNFSIQQEAEKMSSLQNALCPSKLSVIYFQALQGILHMAETQKHGLTTLTEHFPGDFTEFLTRVTGPCMACTEDTGFKSEAWKSET